MIEMVVVVALLGLMLLLVVGHGPPASRGLTTRATAGELAAALREARSRAIGGNRPVSLVLDLARRSYWIDGRPAVELPADLAVTLFTVRGEVRDAAHGGIRFDPDGSSTGGRIELSNGPERMRIGVDWLTGTVSVSDAQR